MSCHNSFFNHGFKFQDSVCNGCHDFTMLSVNVNDVAIITIKNVDYRCIIHNIDKSEANDLLKKSLLDHRGYIYKNIFLNLSLLKTVFFYFFRFPFMKELIVNIVWAPKNLAKLNIGTVMRNTEILELVPDHFKTKKMCKHAVKNLPYL